MRSEAVQKADLDDRYLVPALDRGLALLRLFNHDARTRSLKELGASLKLSPATVFRLVYTLERRNFLQKIPGTRNYRLGVGVLGLGFEFLSSMDVVDVGRPFLEELRDRIGANAHLGVRDGHEVVYVLRVQANARLVSNIQVGTRLPLHTNGMGQVLLADLDDEELAALYRGRKLEMISPQTPATVKELATIVGNARRDGFIISRRAIYPDVASVAAPIRDAHGRIIAAINVVGHERTLVKAGISTTVKDAVVDIALKLSAALGYGAASKAMAKQRARAA